MKTKYEKIIKGSREGEKIFHAMKHFELNLIFSETMEAK